MKTARPLPIPDRSSAPFWDAAAEHRLVMARCRVCQMFALPPDSVCPHCGSTEPNFEFTEVSGAGTVRSWTVARQSFLPGFDDLLPMVLVDVELVEQSELRMVGRLIDGGAERLRVGTAVAVAFEDLAPGIAVPAFELADD